MNEALRVDMFLAAKDEATQGLAATNAELRQMQAQLKATAGSSAKATDASKTLTAAQRLEATQVGQSAKNFQDLTGKITGFLGAATFAASAIGGIAAAVGGVIVALQELGRDKTMEHVEVMVAGAAKATGELVKEVDALVASADKAEEALARATGDTHRADLIAAARATRDLRTEEERAAAAKYTAMAQEKIQRDQLVILAAAQARFELLAYDTAGKQAVFTSGRKQAAENVAVLSRQIAETEERIRAAMNAQVDAAGVLESAANRRALAGMPIYGPGLDKGHLDAVAAEEERVGKIEEGFILRGIAQRQAAARAAEQSRQREADAIRELERALAGTVSDLTRAEVEYEQELTRLTEARISTREREARETLAILRLQAAQSAHRQAAEDAAKKKRDKDRADYAAEQAQAAKDATAAEKAALAERLQAYMAFSAGLDVYREATGSLSEISPGLARVADGLADIAKYAFIAANATDGATEAIFGLVAASGKTALSLVKDTQARALGEALLYTGLATAAAFTPGMQWQAAGYGLAAAQLFIAAGTGGKKSASVAAAAAAAANDNTVGGAITNIYNLGSGSRDVIGQAHLDRRLAGEQRHTGYDQRAAGW